MNKIISLVLFLSSIFSNTLSQPNWVWGTSTIGTSALDEGTDIFVDQTGNINITGVFRSSVITFGNFSLVRTGFSNIYIASFDPSGNNRWVATADLYNFNAIVTSKSIITDEMSNSYISGGYVYCDSISLGAFTLQNAGQNDLYISKLDSSGNFLWVRGFGSSGSDIAEEMAIDDDGNIYITGHFDSDTLVFDSNILIKSGIRDAFIVKINPLGNVVWAKNMTGAYLHGYCIIVDKDFNIYTSGTFTSPFAAFDSIILSNTDTFFFDGDIYIAKYDSSGTLIWAKSAGGNDDDEPDGLAVDNDGNCFVIGKFNSTSFNAGNFIIPAIGLSDVFIVKYDYNGIPLWTNSAVGIGYDYGKSIAVDLHGNIIATGYYQGPALTIDTTTIINSQPGNVNSFIAGFNNVTGNLLWVSATINPGSEFINNLFVDPSNMLYTIGHFNSPLFNLGNVTFFNSGNNQDIFLAKAGLTTFLSEENALSNSLNVHPNPSSGQFRVASSFKIENITILDPSGVIIANLSPLKNSVDFTIAREGIYFAIVHGYNKTVVKKLIVLE